MQVKEIHVNWNFQTKLTGFVKHIACTDSLYVMQYYYNGTLTAKPVETFILSQHYWKIWTIKNMDLNRHKSSKYETITSNVRFTCPPNELLILNTHGKKNNSSIYLENSKVVYLLSFMFISAYLLKMVLKPLTK